LGWKITPSAGYRKRMARKNVPCSLLSRAQSSVSSSQAWKNDKGVHSPAQRSQNSSTSSQGLVLSQRNSDRPRDIGRRLPSLLKSGASIVAHRPNFSPSFGLGLSRGLVPTNAFVVVVNTEVTPAALVLSLVVTR